jgi:gentisate 1,2-dioxygenase
METDPSTTAAAEAFYAELPTHGVWPLWKQAGFLTAEPTRKAKAHVWRYDDLRPLLLAAGDLITAEEAERRVLMLVNPALDGRPAATATLYAGLQLVLPGELAPSHRHAASALRLIVEGRGAFSAVAGEQTVMEPGDLVLTPNWSWHAHGNESQEPVIWLDGLDAPLIGVLDVSFFEKGAGLQELTEPDDSSASLYAASRLNPAWRDWDRPYTPVVRYPWTQTERVLARAAAAGPASPTDGAVFEYTNPHTGGSVLPTMACFVQLLAPGLHTEAHRHTTSVVYHALRGSGTTIADGVAIDWHERDTFSLPGWSVHEHVNASKSDPAVLFSFTDHPVIRSLGLYREQACKRQA